MCIAEWEMKNPHYWRNHKQIRNARDHRLESISIPCGKCNECRKSKAKEWKIRLLEEYKTIKKGQFITLTIDDEHGEKLERELQTKDSDVITKKCVKRFLDRWRKEFKHSARHFLITELGHKKSYKHNGLWKETTQRVHLHGIIFEDNYKFGHVRYVNSRNKKEGRISEKLNKIWKYGQCQIGYTSVNEKMINYVTKYITKQDNEHKGYFGAKLSSPGMGAEYITRNAKRHEYKGEKTVKTYKLRNGQEAGLPTYYKRKLWTDKQRENLRLIELDKNIVRVGKIEIDKTKDPIRIQEYEARTYEQEKHDRLNLWQEKNTIYSWKGGEILGYKNQKDTEWTNKKLEPNINFYDTG